jgi:3-dehydroquinate synthase
MVKTSTSIRVDLSHQAEDRSYDILIREGILEELAGGLVPLPEAKSYFIVTDTNVAGLYGRKLRAGLSGLGRGKVELLSFRGGEGQKNIGTVETLASGLSRLGADRGSVILALGGGVVGDVAGFTASIYKRGIGYVQLPTTLLAQVDSSIGGKTGVDAPWGKNQLGTFYQPLAVLSDPKVLNTLPHAEMLNGLAEIVKCGMIADEGLFERVSALSDLGASGIPTELIAGACRIKADVVSKDEKERDLRSVLNYGHTVGHAIEASSKYRLGHGKCVILGMFAEGWIAVQMGILQREDFERQSELLMRLYEGSGAGRLRFLLNDDALVRFAFADKKTTASSLRMSLPERIGKMHTTKEGSTRSLFPSRHSGSQSITFEEHFLLMTVRDSLREV